MKTDKDCKVLFNTLVKRIYRKSIDDEIINLPFFEIDQVAGFIMKLTKTKRFYEMQNNKFCFLDSLSIIKNVKEPIYISGLFKSARNEFRPNLINKKNGSERRNPKEISEGDIEKTHFVIKTSLEDNEVFLFLESNYHGVSIQNIVNYFNHFTAQYLTENGQKKNYSLKYSIIPLNNFLTELEQLERTKVAEIYFDKKLLGSEALNFSNRTISIKKDLKLVVSAKLKESITEVAVDFYNVFSKNNSEISKVRIYGQDDENNEIVLDTSFMGRIEYINVEINKDTGEVNSSQLFEGLRKIAKSF